MWRNQKSKWCWEKGKDIEVMVWDLRVGISSILDLLEDFFGWVPRDMRRLGKKFWRRIWMTGKEFKCFGLFDFSGLRWFCFSENSACMLRVSLGWWWVTWEDVIWKGTIYLQDWIRGSRHVGRVGHRRVKVGENIRGISKCMKVRSRSIRVF